MMTYHATQNAFLEVYEPKRIVRICENAQCAKEFSVLTHGKVLRRFCSKSCANRTWREEHREEVHVYSVTYGRAYHILHREEQNIKHRSYNMSNRKKLSAANAKIYAENREEILAKHRAYYEANKEKRDAQIKTYRKSHPEVGQAASSRRRAKLAAAPINDFTRAQWESVKEHYDYRCVYCPDTCWRCQRRKHQLTIDHIIPISKGGSHTVSNIAPACSRCNKKKNAGPPPRPVQPLLFPVP